MLPVSLRRKLWKYLWLCLLLSVAVVNVIAYLAPPVPGKPTPSTYQPQEFIIPGRSVTTGATPQLLNIQDSNQLPEVSEWLQESMFGWVFGVHTIMVDLMAYGSRTLSVELPQPSSYVLQPKHYVYSVAPRQLLATGGVGDPRPPEGGRLQEVRDYFTFLKRPQAMCRKLVTVGGRLDCNNLTDDLMDGSKVVCMDPPLELPPGKDPRSCLTLSFGIHVDASFDEAISDLNCEIHMFDLLDYSPKKLLRKSRHAYFHQVGLSDTRRQNYYLNLKKELPVDNLVGILINNSLIARPIHILKVDIEDDEWSVFEQVVTEPIMNAIGQIAIEVHAEDIVKVPVKERLAYVQRRYDVLRAIESRGFQSVAYWENKQSITYHDSSGASYNTCGEIHYVNSKWYTRTFKENLKKMGFKFR
ncbi:probable methyltransferase-like protein 24 [Panulirus ornatus]|uniref:probable methyltransferase-like protein 24 n=1 Tax=Panulirus ornatus TaxID=150431 RepID=UPI003A8C00CC